MSVEGHCVWMHTSTVVVDHVYCCDKLINWVSVLVDCVWIYFFFLYRNGLTICFVDCVCILWVTAVGYSVWLYHVSVVLECVEYTSTVLCWGWVFMDTLGERGYYQGIHTVWGFPTVVCLCFFLPCQGWLLLKYTLRKINKGTIYI